MEKDKKFGFSIGVLSMLCFFLAYTDFVFAAILAVIIFFFAENKTLKMNAASALTFSAILAAVRMGVNEISLIIRRIVEWVFSLFSGSDAYSNLTNIETWLFRFDIFRFIGYLINIFALIMMIVFVIKALKGGVVKVPFVSKVIEKSFNDDAEE